MVTDRNVTKFDWFKRNRFTDAMLKKAEEKGLQSVTESRSQAARKQCCEGQQASGHFKATKRVRRAAGFDCFALRDLVSAERGHRKIAHSGRRQFKNAACGAGCRGNFAPRTICGISWMNSRRSSEGCSARPAGGLIERSSPRGTAIDMKRRRRWIGNFSTYRHQVSDQSITDGLSSLRMLTGMSPARLLDVVDFYSMDRIQGFQNSFAALPGWHATAAQRHGRWRFAGLSRSAGESADAMMHRFRLANGLDAKKYNDLFIHPSQILLEKLGPDDTLVFIDDFVGTGNSVCRAWEESFAELVSDIGRVFLVVVAAIEEGRKKVADKTSLTCVAGHELTERDEFFRRKMRNFHKGREGCHSSILRTRVQKRTKGIQGLRSSGNFPAPFPQQHASYILC